MAGHTSVVIYVEYISLSKLWIMSTQITEITYIKQGLCCWATNPVECTSVEIENVLIEIMDMSIRIVYEFSPLQVHCYATYRTFI